MYANLAVINQIRKDRGLNTFALRPHCGKYNSSELLFSERGGGGYHPSEVDLTKDQRIES